MIREIVIGGLTFLLVACGLATPLPAPTSTATVAPSSPAEPSLGPLLTPTSLSELMPATETLEFSFPPATQTSEGTPLPELDCRLASQSIQNGHHFLPRERFDIGWKVRNIGALAWDAASVDFGYVGGARMFVAERYPLERTVNPGETVALTAEMLAPRQSGRYTTAWTLHRGEEYFCRVTLTIIVP